MWYDAAGNVIQKAAAGDGGVFNKSTYNGAGWQTATYRGYNTAGVSYAQAASVANDTIFSQSENTYDEAGNVVSVVSSERLNDATGTGALTAGTQPKARMSYAATWFDGIDRPIAAANYGAIASFTRPSTAPARSDDVLVSETAFDDAGRAWKVIDPRGIENRTAFDAAGRTTQTVEAYSATIADDTNRTTNYTYTLDSQIATLTAINARTGDQTTTYTYGTTLTDSGVARNDLLRYAAYPDSTGSSDRTAITYNRLGQRTTFTDQRGTVHSYDYDKLGRRTHDRVTTVGSNTDNAVLRISRTYEVRGMVQTITSYDSATVGAGTVLDQVRLEYNSFGQLAKESQDHAAAVSGSSPNVQYAYASGASGANQIRPTTLTYPNARAITYDYGAAGGADDRLNRVAAIMDGATTLAAHTRLGLGTVIRIDYPQPQVRLDLWGGTSGTFTGLDAFNRIKDQRWLNYNTSADLDRYAYGYDRNSSRVWKQNPLTTGLDEFYTYDQLNRLATMDRGTLNAGKTGITGTPAVEQDWTLDPTGNWRGYVTKAAGTTDLNQSRTHNPANEITSIAETAGPSWIDPAYDAAGNTTTFPKAGNPTQALTATFDPWNRMTQVKDAGILIARYRYDGRSRRIVIESYTVGTLIETRHVYYTNGWQAVEERVGSGITADRQYVWGVRYVDELVCRDRDTDANGTLDERVYPLHDANFDVTATVDASGNVIDRFIYDRYGAFTVLDPSWSADADGVSDAAWGNFYQGLPFDAAAGGSLARIRIVIHYLGRPLQADPIGYVEGMSRYEWEQSNPGTHLDPFGLQAVPTTAPVAPPPPPAPGANAANLVTEVILGDAIIQSAEPYYGPSGAAGYYAALVHFAGSSRLNIVIGTPAPGATATFQNGTMTVSPTVTGPTAAHEMTHALAYLMGWHQMGGYGPGIRRDEALAYGAPYLLAQAQISLGGMRRCTSCFAAQSMWANAWSITSTTGFYSLITFPGVGRTGVPYGVPRPGDIVMTHNLTAEDLWDINAKLGLRFSCTTLKPIYEAMLAAKGIDAGMGSLPCLLPCASARSKLTIRGTPDPFS